MSQKPQTNKDMLVSTPTNNKVRKWREEEFVKNDALLLNATVTLTN